MAADRLTWRPRFIAALGSTGNVRAACLAAGVTRQTVYRTRRQVAEFRRQWEDALEDAVDALAAEARRRALAGSDTLLIYLLKVHGGPEYRNDQRHSVRLEREDRVKAVMKATGATEAEAREAVAEAERHIESLRSGE